MDARFSPQPWTRPATPKTQRKHGNFRTSYTRTLDKLQYELEKIGATEILFECSFHANQIRLDGWPKANQSPEYNGIAVSFNHPEVGRVEYVTDRYFLWQDNLHAIALTLEALRGVERWGVVASGQQYTGFKAITSGNGEGKRGAASWIARLVAGEPLSGDVSNGASVKLYRDVLLEEASAENESKRSIIKAARKKAHPDTGGSHELYQLLTEKLGVLG